MSNLGISGRIVLLSVALPTAWAWWAPTTGALSFRTRTYWSTRKHEHTTEATCNPRCPPIIRAAVNNNMEADRLEHIDTPSANNPLETSTSRGDWLRTGAGLAAMVPLVSSVLLGSPADAAAARAGSGTVTVIGAGGKTGRECVEYLAASGTAVKAVARSLTNKEGEPLQYKTTEKVQLATADVTVPGSLPEVVKGASAVIFASSASKQGGSAKAVDYEGVVNVAKACLDMKVPRLVVVSSGGVASPNSSVYKFLNLFGEIMSWKIRGEDELRSMYAAQGPEAVCHYTIVRPGGLTLDPPRGVTAIELNQGDTKSGRIARADVARVCVESIYSRAAEDCTLECYYKDTGKPLDTVGLSNILKQTTKPDESQALGTERTGSSWEELFTGLKRDAT